MSKSLKQMAYDTIEAHQETIVDLRTQLAKANERVMELEDFNKELRCAIHQGSASVVQALLKKDKEGEASLNKFALEKKIGELEASREDFYQKRAYLASDFLLDGTTCKKVAAWFDVRIEQLRKEQE